MCKFICIIMRFLLLICHFGRKCQYSTWSPRGSKGCSMGSERVIKGCSAQDHPNLTPKYFREISVFLVRFLLSVAARSPSVHPPPHFMRASDFVSFRVILSPALDSVPDKELQHRSHRPFRPMPSGTKIAAVYATAIYNMIKYLLIYYATRNNRSNLKSLLSFAE